MLNMLCDALIFYFCLLIIAVWLVVRFFFGVDIFAPCVNDNRCSVALVQKYAAENGRIATCQELSKADMRECK